MNNPNKLQEQTKNDNSEKSNRVLTNQSRSIISLSKLKNYMPQNQLAARFFNPVHANQTQFNQSNSSLFHANQSQSISALYRNELNSPDQSSSASLAYFNSNHEKLASVKALSLTSQLNLNNRARQSNTSLRIGTSLAANHLVCDGGIGAQARQTTGQQKNDSQTATIWDSAEGVEPSQDQQRQRRSIGNSGSEQRKQDRIDIGSRREDSTLIRKDKRDESNEERLERARRAAHLVEKQSGGYSKNNMTPSSLLLLQNHNYIEQQQQLHLHQHQQEQPRNIASQYTTTTDANTQVEQRRGEDSIGQVRISDVTVDTEACHVKKSDDNQQSSATSNSSLPIFQPPLSSSSSSVSTSSSSHMLTNIHQFKALDSIGNPSIETSIVNSNNNNTSAAQNANLVNSSNSYLASQDLNQLNNHLTEADLASVSTNNSTNLQHSYQQSLAFKDTVNVIDPQQFVNYGNQNSRQINNYHQNFQASMLGQQIKLENVVNHRGIFEDNNHNAVNQGVPISNSTAESISMARNLARQQTRSSIDQYYNNHYNLMPQISSKSSSPASATSSPSPKTNAMHHNTNQQQQHSDQIISSVGANSSSSQMHLGGMNNHYASVNVADAGNLLNHQQHQVNQHYPYTQSANGQNHHLAIPQHDQAYAHHQQQQLPTSHHQEQHHNQQTHQNHQQQQHHHQQSNLSQQSIYHHLANNNGNMSMNHLYGNTGASAHYQNQLQASTGNHQTNHLMHGAHQNHHLNSAAAACAAAVVSQTLKTVAHQHSQHQYGGTIASGFNPSAGNLMNMTAQHHQQFHAVNQLNSNHLGNNQQANQHQQHQNLPVHHTAGMVTRKYECKMCPQVFMSKAEMKYHNQNHMREAKPYKCLQCPKAFANSSYLSQHMRIHQGVKPYTCDICSRKFTQLSHLQQHKRTHTGDKPYKCNYMNCTKQFSQLSNLQSHSRCHQLDKPYKCNSCYKCFHDEQSLLEHIPRHLESKHLKKNLCIFCGSSYQQERGLVKHFQQYHTDKKPALVAAAIAAGTTGNSNLIASIVSSAAPNVNGSSSSSSISSVSSSGSVNVHNNLTIVNVAQGASGGSNHYC